MALIRFSFYSPPPPPPHKNLKKSSPRTTRRASTLLALSVLIALATLLSLSATASAQSTTDYDSDNDGYIDVNSLAQLNAIRHDLDGNGDPTSGGATAYGAAFPDRVTTSSGRMGCPSGTCTGYELTASLDFDSDSDGDVDANDHSGAYWDTGKGWMPIGASSTNLYAANFKGNGHTINNLFISRSTTHLNGLFGFTGSNSRIETLGIINASVTGQNNTGILAGTNRSTIVACYTTGSVSGGNSIGGLVGVSIQGSISTSYSTAYVNGVSNVGGLIGGAGISITNSYATGRVVRSSETATTIGGLIGNAYSSPPVTASYWDTSTSGQTASAGGSGVVGKTTRELQSVTTYTGIYANWNIDLDNADSDNDASTGKDNPWTFGNKMQYPMLQYKMMSTTPQNSQAMGRSDNWNAPIVGERVGVCLNAATFPNRKGAWIWERSDNGDTWETISGWRQPTYEYTPTTADVNHYLRAKVALSGGGFAYTRALGGRVKNASAATAGAAITFVSGSASPRVGTEIVASDPRPAGAVDARVAWQRCPNVTAPHTDCSYIHGPGAAWGLRYTPTSADLNQYLRFYMYYATSAGVWTRHMSGFTGQVAAASQ